MDDLGQILDIAKQNLERDGELVPVLFVEGDARLVVALRNFGRTADDRAALLYALGQQLAYLRPRRVVLVNDAYIREGEPPVAGSLADYPDAREAIVVAALDADGCASALVLPYEREPSLEGLRFGFKAPPPFTGDSRTFLLEAFFDGCSPSRS